ncbi:cAMP-binding domain of CRP or a regulatory subunit of cAMP-dependent protein kinases [Devosia crocina]|uniref:cAMP-binding domain of CRP or a regulatory subunit of cAMP-dependent protein kinases n=1 Tax=Devosia crocina TaxID=429728 RepID=A0A1I7NRJ4_9HYPH|nr:Crp/Fnr family transcriptional regulator [Devosia crocina]SFV37289.1 cAMP-binding domain of CRP or a regulatory subunit of cAMP-dependent protein kinases [Devosia crocina]
MQAQQDSPNADFLSKLIAGSLMGGETIARIMGLPWIRTSIARGDKVSTGVDIAIIGTGWAARYREIEHDAKQMLSLHVPRDLCSYQFLDGRSQANSLYALTPMTVWTLKAEELLRPGVWREDFAMAVLAALATDKAISEEHLVSLGSRTALGRMAHLIAELQWRLSPSQPPQTSVIDFPLSQPRLAEYLSLSSVHVNRTLQALRRDGVIRTSSRNLTILDQPRLETIGGFNARYLVPEGGAGSASPSPERQAPSGGGFRSPTLPQ